MAYDTTPKQWADWAKWIKKVKLEDKTGLIHLEYNAHPMQGAPGGFLLARPCRASGEFPFPWIPTEFVRAIDKPEILVYGDSFKDQELNRCIACMAPENANAYLLGEYRGYRGIELDLSLLNLPRRIIRPVQFYNLQVPCVKEHWGWTEETLNRLIAGGKKK